MLRTVWRNLRNECCLLSHSDLTIGGKGLAILLVDYLDTSKGVQLIQILPQMMPIVSSRSPYVKVMRGVPIIKLFEKRHTMFSKNV